MKKLFFSFLFLSSTLYGSADQISSKVRTIGWTGLTGETFEKLGCSIFIDSKLIFNYFPQGKCGLIAKDKAFLVFTKESLTDHLVQAIHKKQKYPITPLEKMSASLSTIQAQVLLLTITNIDSRHESDAPTMLHNGIESAKSLLLAPL
jgi:hypothetical protein